MRFAELQDGRTQITDMSLAVGKVSTGSPRRSNCWYSRVSGSTPHSRRYLKIHIRQCIDNFTRKKMEFKDSRPLDRVLSYYIFTHVNSVYTHTHTQTHTHTHTHTHTTCFPAKKMFSKRTLPSSFSV